MDGQNTMQSQCPECGAALNIGDWPFCNKTGVHGSIYPDDAQSFQPLIVDRDVETGQLSYPGSASDPVPTGHVRETLSTISQVDRFCRDRSMEETEKRRLTIRAEREYFDQRTKERREQIRSVIAKRGFSGKLFDMITQRIDARREKRYTDLLNREVHFFSDVFAFNSSNRNPHSDESTGWKSRKG